MLDPARKICANCKHFHKEDIASKYGTCDKVIYENVFFIETGNEKEKHLYL